MPYHSRLIIWVIFFSKGLSKISGARGITNRAEYYKMIPCRRIRARNLNKISHIISAEMTYLRKIITYLRRNYISAHNKVKCLHQKNKTILKESVTQVRRKRGDLGDFSLPSLETLASPLWSKWDFFLKFLANFISFSAPSLPSFMVVPLGL